MISNTGTKPTSLEDALSPDFSDHWLAPTSQELMSHIKNETFVVSDLPSGVKSINSMFVFDIKKLAGDKEKKKARFVAKGCSQIPGLHFDETFAPTLQPSTFRTVMAISTQFDFHIEQMDVETAFLIPPLPEEEKVYMKPPRGFEELCRRAGIPFRKGQVLELKKCIYGLKQSGRYWNKAFVDALKNLGLSQSPYDCCLFISGSNIDNLLLLIVYVDDVLIASKSATRAKVLQDLLGKIFPLKLLGSPRLWTGIEICRQSHGGYFLSQEKYILRSLQRIGMEDCTPALTPVEGLLSRNDDQPPASADVQNSKYRTCVGILLWISLHTRPDICFAVSQVARFCEKPSTAHWKAVQRIFRYLKGTVNYGLDYKKTEKNFYIAACGDASWATAFDRQSPGGFATLLGSCLVAWRCFYVKSICLSSMEAELCICSAAAQEIIHLKYLTAEILDADMDAVLFCDNTAALAASRNPVATQRSKHIDIKHFFVRDCVRDKILETRKVDTEKNPADAFTKPVTAEKMQTLLRFCALRPHSDC